MVKNKKDTIEDIFYQILKTKKLKNFNKLKIGQVSRWDSLNNLNYLLKIEEKFNIKFTISEMATLNSIKKIRKTLETKIKNKQK